MGSPPWSGTVEAVGAAGRLGRRQVDHEAKAVRGGALGVHGAAVKLDDRMHDRQPQSRPLDRAGTVGPGEAVEDPAQVALGETGAVVLDLETHRAVPPAGAS